VLSGAFQRTIVSQEIIFLNQQEHTICQSSSRQPTSTKQKANNNIHHGRRKEDKGRGGFPIEQVSSFLSGWCFVGGKRERILRFSRELEFVRHHWHYKLKLILTHIHTQQQQEGCQEGHQVRSSNPLPRGTWQQGRSRKDKEPD
jgi:hypothetical protein